MLFEKKYSKINFHSFLTLGWYKNIDFIEMIDSKNYYFQKYSKYILIVFLKLIYILSNSTRKYKFFLKETIALTIFLITRYI